MAKILITGGFGFLGSHLIDVLSQNPHNQIHVVDNLSSNVIRNDDRVTFDDCSVLEFLKKTEIKFDQIYHLASVVGPAGVIPYQGRIALYAITDAYAVAARAVGWGARLLFVSTSEVYGGGDDGLCAEYMDLTVSATTSARLEYAVGKLAAETCLINLSKVRGLNVVIVRPFNIAGPRQSGKGGFVLPRFIQSAKANEPLTVFGKGKQVRAFTHARDVAEGLKLVMSKGIDGEVYNVGSAANKTTILELADRVIKQVGSKSTIEFVDPREVFGSDYAEAYDKFPDSSKIEELGWTPQRDLSTIIKDSL